jgi:fluoroquinolone transport system permease protein
MNARTIFRTLGPIDARNIFRDANFKWMIFLPVFLALLLRFGLPPFSAWLQAAYTFDLIPFYPAILGYFFVLMCPMIFGMLTGFLLIDERDDNTLTALQVTPLPFRAYLAYRVAIPIVLTIVLMFVIFPLSGLGVFPPEHLLLTALAAAPTAPLFGLTLAAFARNKVQGFAVTKMLGAVLIIPIFAYFTDSPWEYAYGVFPTYWPMKVYWLLEAGEPGVWPILLVAVVYQLFLTKLLADRLHRELHR